MPKTPTPAAERTSTSVPQRYDGVARALHWLIAALILGLVALGWWLTQMSYYDRWYQDALFWHRALGMAVLPLAAWQIVRRAVRGTPAPAPGLAAWERAAAKAAHRAFFALMFALPLSGYVISTSAGAPVPLPGGLAIPALFEAGDAARDAAVSLHYWLGYGVAALAAVHAAAAFKHQWLDGAGVLRRMV